MGKFNPATNGEHKQLRGCAERNALRVLCLLNKLRSLQDQSYYMVVLRSATAPIHIEQHLLNNSEILMSSALIIEPVRSSEIAVNRVIVLHDITFHKTCFTVASVVRILTVGILF